MRSNYVHCGSRMYSATAWGEPVWQCGRCGEHRPRAVRAPAHADVRKVSASYAVPSTDPGAQRAAGEANDCAVRALAVACAVSYDAAHAACEALGRTPRRGTPLAVIQAAARALLGAEPQRLSCALAPMTVGRAARFLPEGHYVLWTCSHALALTDGTVHDWERRSLTQRVVGGIRLA